MTTISCMTANYVARQLNYRMTSGWGQGDAATQAFFRPLDTFAERFEDLLAEIADLGFEAIDLWLAHLHPTWATPDHIATAEALLGKFGLRVNSLAGSFGSTHDEFAASCRLAVALGAPILGGSTPLLASNRADVVALLEAHDLVLGYENHPEKNPAEVLAKIGGGVPGRIGVAIDTGWFGTQGYNAATAIVELSATLVYVHLKDVLAAGAHETCRYGHGIVPIAACVHALQQIGYQGGISVEHEPEHSNPNDDVRASLALLQGLLA
ncbi:sugar phosphate isomerase/epimerase [Candidatus Gracilibacteria bacterium]|nr:sugar phosphate isomerase/epimerase [Candidatus Gracilibacteria bacterium]